MPGELLRFSTAGSVDDGKSTLIGRLLYDAKGAYEDQIASARQKGSGLDLALLTDGLRAEREQGITIDVAYRYFATPRRKFIIADTPGHEQYTRNMATGASTADLAVVLVDARKGVLPQSRRHAYIASLLGIPRLAVAVNKMDLVDYREEIFDSIRAEFRAFAAPLGVDLDFIPVSALCGDNVVSSSRRMPWFTGAPLLQYLEEAPVAIRPDAALRFAVQYIIRPNLDFRGYAGQVTSGVLHRGDPVVVLPSGRQTRIKSITTWDGELEEAAPPQSVTVCLEDEIDISRGDMLVSPEARPHISRRFEAMVVWMTERPLEPGRTYLLKHTTRQMRATVKEIRHAVDIHSLEKRPAPSLGLNVIGRVALEAHRPLYFDSYADNRLTGSFIFIDPATNETAGAGMIASAIAAGAAKGPVTHAERALRFGHRAVTVWLDAGQEVLELLERKLFDHGCAVAVAADADAAQALSAAGLLVLSNAAPHPLPGPHTIVIDRGALGDSPADSADAVWAILEREGVFAPDGTVSQGGGI